MGNKLQIRPDNLPTFGYSYAELELTAAAIAHHIQLLKNEDVVALQIGNYVDVFFKGRNLEDYFQVMETTTRAQHRQHVVKKMRALLKVMYAVIRQAFTCIEIMLETDYDNKLTPTTLLTFSRIAGALAQESLAATELRILHQYNTTDTPKNITRTQWERCTVKAGEHNPLAVYSNNPQTTLDRKYQAAPLELNIAGMLKIPVRSLELVNSDFQLWYMTYSADQIRRSIHIDKHISSTPYRRC